MAVKKHMEAMLHDRWCAQLPYMTKDTFVTFGEYVERNTFDPSKVDLRPTDVILAELLEEEKRKENAINGNGDI